MKQTCFIQHTMYVLIQVINTSKMIRVNAPQLSKFNATIQLDQQLTAADVLARFSSSPELARSRDSGT